MTLNLSKKLIIITAAPLLVMFAFAVILINDRLAQQSMVKELKQISMLVEESAPLIEQIQRERSILMLKSIPGLSTTVSDKKLQNLLTNTTKMTNAFILDIHHYLRSVNKSEYQSDLAHILADMQSFLVQKKLLLTHNNTARKDIFTIYSHPIIEILHFLTLTQTRTQDKTIAFNLFEIQHIAKLTEAEEQLRAITPLLVHVKNNYFFKERFYYNIQNRSQLFSILYDHLGTREYQLLITVTKSKESAYMQHAIEDILHHLRDNKPFVKPFNDIKWFEQTAMYTHLYQKLFKEIIKDIHTNINEQNTAMKNHIALLFLGVIMISFFTIFLIIFMSNHIIQKIYRLQKSIIDIFSFLQGKKHSVPLIDIKGSDEITQIAQELNSAIAHFSETFSEDQKFIVNMTEILYNMQEGDFNHTVDIEPGSRHLIQLRFVFNKLISLINDKINEHTKSLQEHNKKLDKEVKLQTQALNLRLEELQIARDKAQESERLKGEFLANMSHEIRTPLNAILGFVEQLQKRIENETSKSYLNTISRSGETLLGVINDILDFSKIESGAFTIQNEAFEPLTLLSDIIELFSPRISEKEINNLSFIDPRLPKVLEGDNLRIKQILSNLFSNALKFTPSKGTITFEAYYKDGKLICEVKDSGIGIEKSRQASIFKAFEQEDSSTTRAYGGTGLGLAISSKLAQLMGGSLEVESQKNEGSLFRLTLPFEMLDTQKAFVLEEELLQKYTVAILDFPPHKLELHALLIRYLEHFDLSPIQVPTLEEAKKAYATIIISHHTYKQNNPDHIPLIYVSQFNHNYELYNAHEWYLKAPFTPQSILEALDEVTEEHIRVQPEEAQNTTPLFEAEVLVAEDNKTNQMLMTILLEDYGIGYTLANDGLEAVAAFKEKKFDLILMDINMPNLSGDDAAKEIIAIEQNAHLMHTPIIALTANVLPEDIHSYKQAGMDDILGKPIETHKLEAIFYHYLKEKKREEI